MVNSPSAPSQGAEQCNSGYYYNKKYKKCYLIDPHQGTTVYTGNETPDNTNHDTDNGMSPGVIFAIVIVGILVLSGIGAGVHHYMNSKKSISGENEINNDNIEGNQFTIGE